jgi:hypothetical protein
MGKGECGSMDDLKWLVKIPKYCMLKLITQEGCSAFAQKPCTFCSLMGLCSS